MSRQRSYQYDGRFAKSTYWHRCDTGAMLVTQPMKATIMMQTDVDTFAALREHGTYFVFGATPGSGLKLREVIEGDLDAPEGLSELSVTSPTRSFQARVENNKCEALIAIGLLKKLRSPTRLETLNSQGHVEVLQL